MLPVIPVQDLSLPVLLKEFSERMPGEWKGAILPPDSCGMLLRKADRFTDQWFLLLEYDEPSSRALILILDWFEQNGKKTVLCVGPLYAYIVCVCGGEDEDDKYIGGATRIEAAVRAMLWVLRKEAENAKSLPHR